MKKFLVMEVVALTCLSYFLYANDSVKKSLERDLRQAESDAERAWKELEKAEPSLTKQYSQMFERHKSLRQQYDRLDGVGYLIAIPFSLLFAAVVLECILASSLSCRKNESPAQHTGGILK